MEQLIKRFIELANDFDINASLKLFAEDAVIDDVSVGETFVNKSGVSRYLETFFVGYKTKTRIDSLEIIDSFNTKVKVDFTGSFGHETGGLDIAFDENGLIKKIDAYLE